MPTPQKNYYTILQVDPPAEVKVIRAAYRRLARKYHPDVNKSADATRRMQEINEAYEVLSDPLRRARYDRMRRAYSGPTQTVQEQWQRERAAEAWRAAAERAQREAEARRRHEEQVRQQAKAAEDQRYRAFALVRLLPLAWFVFMLCRPLTNSTNFALPIASVRGGIKGSISTPSPSVSTTVIGSRERQQADSLVLTSPSGWTGHIEDNFEANINHWEEGQDDHSEGEIMVWNIRDNKYFWTVDTEKPNSWWVFGPLEHVRLRNYLISVETELVEGDSGAIEFGLVLNSTANGSYAFGFYDDGFWFFSRVSRDHHFTDLDQSQSAAIHVKDTNQLKVHVINGHFTLFINGEKVGYVEDTTNPTGAVGLFVGTGGSESPVTVSFDNYKIQGQPPFH